MWYTPGKPRKDTTPFTTFDLSAFRAILQRYDPKDLLTAISALQLLPDNAGRSIRLEALAHAAVAFSCPHSPPISSSDLANLCRSLTTLFPDLISHEDPPENPFTEPFYLFDDRFTVFPGWGEGTTYNLGLVTKALLCGSPDTYSENFLLFLRGACRFLYAALSLSDAAARAANLGEILIPNEPLGNSAASSVNVPDDAALGALQQAVLFSESQLRHLLASQGVNLQDLEPVILTIDDARSLIHPDSYHIHLAPLRAFPLLRFTDGTYLLVFPGSLMDAVIAHTVGMAAEMGVEEEFAGRIEEAVEASVCMSMTALGCRIDAVLEKSGPGPHLARNAYLLGFDDDKGACVLPIVDAQARFPLPIPLGIARQEREPSCEDNACSLEELAMQLADEVRGVEAIALESMVPPSELLVLIVCQTLGGLNSMDLSYLADQIEDRRESHTPGAFGRVLVLTAEDLDVITAVSAGDPLALWKFAVARDELRRCARVQSTGILEEFYSYRRGHHVLFPTLFADAADQDTENKATCLFLPGFSVQLRAEVKSQNRRMVVGYDDASYVEVTRLHRSHRDPLYVRRTPQREPAVYVDGLPLPVWVTDTATGEDEKAGLDKEAGDAGERFLPLFNLARIVAYWVWQTTPALTEILGLVVQRYERLQIMVGLDAACFTTTHADLANEDEAPVRTVVDREQGIISIMISPVLQGLLANPDNAGDRMLVRELLKAFAALTGRRTASRLQGEKLEQSVDKHAPLGFKRMMLSFNPWTSGLIDPRGLLPWRPIQSIDRARTLKRLGTWIAQEHSLPAGPVPDQDKQGLLRLCVRRLYESLVAFVASLHPEGLLERLLAQQEAVAAAQTQHEMTAATQINCFEADTDLVLGKELADFFTANIASRFLIEYVAAKPPRGLRPISMSVYDELASLAAAIVDYGNADDMRHHRLGNVDVSIGADGIVSLGLAEFHDARRSQQPVLRSEQFHYAAEAFRRGSTWETSVSSAGSDTKEEELVEEACIAEWGLTLTEIIKFHRFLEDVGEETGPVVVAVSEERLKSDAQRRLGWTREKIQAALARMILVPRENFLDPPPPFDAKTDVLPWRFSRRLSYLQRPLVYRKIEGAAQGQFLWGRRNLMRSLELTLELIYDGRLRAESDGMKRFLGRANAARGKAFNAEVAARLSGRPGWIVRREVKEWWYGDSLVAPPGDIDVLAADPQDGKLYVIECKSLAVARNPHELASEMEALNGEKKGTRTAARQVTRKAAWVAGNLPAVGQFLGVDVNPSWQLVPLVVVDHVMLSPYLKDLGAPVWTVDEI